MTQPALTDVSMIQRSSAAKRAIRAGADPHVMMSYVLFPTEGPEFFERLISEEVSFPEEASSRIHVCA